MTLTDTFAAYRHAHHAHAKATARAQAASARYTAERTRDAREAMGDAWRVCDRAMHVMFDARDAMCGAVLDMYEPEAM